MKQTQIVNNSISLLLKLSMCWVLVSTTHTLYCNSCARSLNRPKMTILRVWITTKNYYVQSLVLFFVTMHTFSGFSTLRGVFGFRGVFDKHAPKIGACLDLEACLINTPLK
jgi:hypothetical protein